MFTGPLPTFQRVIYVFKYTHDGIYILYIPIPRTHVRVVFGSTRVPKMGVRWYLVSAKVLISILIRRAEEEYTL